MLPVTRAAAEEKQGRTPIAHAQSTVKVQLDTLSLGRHGGATDFDQLALYSQPPSATSTSPAQHAHPPHAHAMIGPTPTWYDAEQPPEGPDYHQWIQAQAAQAAAQHHYTPDYSAAFTAYHDPNPAHHTHAHVAPAPQPQPSAPQQQQQQMAPMPNQYQFVHSQPDVAYVAPTPVVPSQSHSHPQQQQQQHRFYSYASDPSSSTTTWVADPSPSVSVSAPPPPPLPMSAQTHTFQQQQPQGPPPSRRPSKRRRRTKGDDGADDSDSDAVFEDEGPSSGLMPPMPVGVVQRLPGACTYCKRLKMKCEFPTNASVCKRCRAGNHHCVVEGRKPRSAPNKKEVLLAQLKQKDGIIEALLKQIRNPYLATPLSIADYRLATTDESRERQDVIAWLDRLQSSVRNPGPRDPAVEALKLDARSLAPAYDPDDSDSDGEEYVARGVGGSGGVQNGIGSAHSSEERERERERDNSEGANGLHPALPDAAVPIGLLAKLAISSAEPKSPGGRKRAGKDAAERGELPEADADEDADGAPVGVASDKYFLPGPSFDLRERMRRIEKVSPPDILVHGIVTPEDVEELFQIFYTRINPFIGVLDPVLHTPSSTFSRCPFLFTVVCAIALRYSRNHGAYAMAMHFARSAAASALVYGWKSAELCQAYILMSIYGVPARRWEEDRAWLYTGLAIRIATDLNLHMWSNKKPRNEVEAREMINRNRIWMICYNMDKSTATQFGKPSTVGEDRIIREGPEWYKRAVENDPFDVHLVAYSSLMRVLTRHHAEIFSDPDGPAGGLNRAVDFCEIALRYDAEVLRTHQEWDRRFREDSDPNNPAAVFRCKLLPFYVSYSRLVILSFAFQQAFQRGLRPEDNVFFDKSFEAAKRVVTVLVDSLAPSGYLRYAPDGHFVFGAFASAFLLKLIRPECKLFIGQGLEQDIYDTIERLVATFGSPEIFIDEKHTPKLYSDFLGRLLAKHRRDAAAAARAKPHGGAGAGQSVARGQAGRGGASGGQGGSGRANGGVNGGSSSVAGGSGSVGGGMQMAAADAQPSPPRDPPAAPPAPRDPPTTPSRDIKASLQIPVETSYPTPSSLPSPLTIDPATLRSSPGAVGIPSPYGTSPHNGASPLNGTSPYLSASPFSYGGAPSPYPPPSSSPYMGGTSPYAGGASFASTSAQALNGAGADVLPLSGAGADTIGFVHGGGAGGADAITFGAPDAGAGLEFTFQSQHPPVVGVPMGELGLVGDDDPATMKALSNPDWWNNMMLPGFYWPADDPMTGNGAMASGVPMQTHNQHNYPGPGPGAGGMNGAYAFQHQQPIITTV